MKVTSKINIQGLNFIRNIAQETLIETADALETDLRKSKTMPFDLGNLQNRDGGISKSGVNVEGTHVNVSKKKFNKVSVVSGAPYARRLYFHPEYNFQKTKNPNAGGMWFESYISGNKKSYASKVFVRIMKGKM